MRRVALFLTASCMLALLPAFGQPEGAVEQFEEGNEHFEADNFEAARAAYEEAIATGYTSGALHYNLGNTYFRLEELGAAIRHYEKARHLLPDDPRLAHNLRIARDRADVPPPTTQQGWRALVTSMPVGLALGFGLLLYLGGWAALGYAARSSTSGRLQLAYRSALGLGTALIVLGLVVSYVQSMDERAVVLVDDTIVHEAPGTEPTANTLREGFVVHVTDRRTEWTRIDTPGDSGGWVPADALGDI